MPVPAPPAVTAVVERYLRLRLEANLDRPQTVRHARDALRRLLVWLAQAHPELTNLAQLRREHAEEFLRWLAEQRNSHTGAPAPLFIAATAWFRFAPYRPSAVRACRSSASNARSADVAGATPDPAKVSPAAATNPVGVNPASCAAARTDATSTSS